MRVELRLGRRRAQVVALANSGFESPAAEVIIPASISSILAHGSAPPVPLVSYTAAGGNPLLLQSLGKGTVSVLAGARRKSVATRFLASSTEREVVMNDVLVGSLGIVLVQVAEGLWRFRDDPPSLERRSSPRTEY